MKTNIRIQLAHVQLTNTVSYCLLLSTGINTMLLLKELLKVCKSNTGDVIFAYLAMAICSPLFHEYLKVRQKRNTFYLLKSGVPDGRT